MERKIRSFVMRGGRLTARQSTGLREYFADYHLSAQEGHWCWQTVFANRSPVVIEIGFGMGHSLVTMAEQNPTINYVGMEVHRAGLGNIAYLLHEKNLTNVRLVDQDAVKMITEHVHHESVHGVQIFFPDPWHKKKHHKRRLIQNTFVELLMSKLVPGGFIHCATDWQDYAEAMLDVLTHHTGLINQSEDNTFVTRPSSRPLTKFEQRGQKLGHGVWDLIFKKRS